MRRRAAVFAVAGAAFLLIFPLGSFGGSSAEDTWSGTWSTNFNEMRLTQTGSHVEGKYDYDDGHLTGTVSGNVLKGRWDEAPSRQGQDAGPFTFTMSASGKSFTGTWRHESNPTEPLGDWHGSCSAGPCLKNGQQDDESVSFRYSAGARHAKTIRSPLGHHTGWLVGTSSLGGVVYTSYVEDGDILDHGAFGDFKVVGKQLRTSGPAKVLKLSLELTSLENGTHRETLLPKCGEGTKATVVLIDDNRLLPGGEAARRQTRDQAIFSISSARCDYFEHKFTNADSHGHTPFVGGPVGSGGPGGRGGQWVDVRIST